MIINQFAAQPCICRGNPCLITSFKDMVFVILSKLRSCSSTKCHQRSVTTLKHSKYAKPSTRRCHVKAAASNQSLPPPQLLAELLQCPDPKATAQKYIDSLDEAFFHTGSVMIQMAETEGNKDVEEQLRKVLMAALEVKQTTLRPEIRLLNRLLQCDNEKDMKVIIRESQGLLLSEDGYFLTLLHRMMGDIEGQPDGPQKSELLAKLRFINNETAVE